MHAECTQTHEAWSSQSPQWESFFEDMLRVVANHLHDTCTHDNTPPAQPWHVSVLLCDDAQIQGLNKQFRGQDKPTNVLSFPADIHEGDPFEQSALCLGDLAFSYNRVVEESKKNHKSFLNHMTHLTIHGILHLLGYDHETDCDAQVMETLEINILQTLEINNPYTQHDAADD